MHLTGVVTRRAVVRRCGCGKDVCFHRKWQELIHVSPDPAPFTSDERAISRRTATTASVVWDIPQWMTVHAKGPEERTPDISNIIQEIVNQPGWSGNIVLMFRDNPAKPSQGTREAESFNGSSDEAPLLHISYQ